MSRLTKEEKARRDELAKQGIKVCCKCKEEKPFSEFSKCKGKAYGVNNKCKICFKQYYQENKELFKQYNQENKGYHKKYYQENKGCILEKQRQYYKENKQHVSERVKQYEQRAEVKERRRNRHKERYDSDPMFKISRTLKSLLNKGFKRKGWRKDSSTQKTLGCSWGQLILWIGDEPSKENHIDHVIPQSLAETPEELKLLNHYTNFQLLKAEENTSKGNRYIRKHNLKRVLAHHPQPDKLKEIVERSNVEII